MGLTARRSGIGVLFAVVYGGLFGVAGLIAAAHGGCASSQSLSKRASAGLTVTMDATDKLANAVREWDRNAGLAIVARSSTREEADAALAIHEGRMAVVDRAVAATYTSLGALSAAISLAQSELKLLPMMTAVLDAFAHLKAAIASVEAIPKGSP